MKFVPPPEWTQAVRTIALDGAASPNASLAVTLRSAIHALRSGRRLGAVGRVRASVEDVVGRQMNEPHAGADRGDGDRAWRDGIQLVRLVGRLPRRRRRW